MRNKTSHAAAIVALFVLGCDGEQTAEQSVEKPLISGVSDDSFRASASCGDCTVVNRSTVMLPLTGKTFTEAKMWSDSTNTGRLIALDERATVVDADALVRAEGRLKTARQGKLRDDVYLISLTTSSDLLPVWIWADYKDEHEPREAMIASAALRASVQAKNQASLRAVTSKITRWLDARGYPTYERGLSDPSITADVPVSALSDLGGLDGVAIVGLRTPGKPAGNIWFPTVKGSAAQAIVSTAAGQSFCNTEDALPSSYANLSVPPAQIYTTSGPNNPHMTWTTELIAATTFSRMAPNATTFIASWGYSSVYNAWQWCFSQGIGAMNRSYQFDGYAFGGLSATDMAQDYYVLHWPYPFITLGAGNCGDEALLDCSTQTNKTVGNRSYNVLVVGGSHDHNTGLTSDDTMATFSAFGNPQTTHSDFELPNVVAPGVDVTTASNILGSGTSAAAPQVLGTALLMMARDSGLVSWPEMIRASILATSAVGVDNATRTTRLGGVGDLKQGAGLLNSLRAVNIADPQYFVFPNSTATQAGRYEKFYNFSTDFTGGVSNDKFYISAPFIGRLRAVIAWDATPTQCFANGDGCRGETLDGDLDLQLQKWNGSFWTNVCASTSFDSSWELCDVAVTAGDSYYISLAKWSTVQPGTYVGVAWYTYDPAND